MRKIYALSFVLALIVLVSCKSASKAYDRGNYDQAVDLAVKKLQKNPNDGDARGILKDAYRHAVDDHESRIREHNNSNNDLKWEWIFNEYNSLQSLHNAIRRSPEAMRVVKSTDYSSYMDTYRDKAADNRYERGMRMFDRGDKKSYREAYREFEVANRIKPGDMNIRERMEEAYDYAVTNIVVMPMDDFRYRYSSYNQTELRNLENELLRSLQSNCGDQFTRFFNQYDARNQNVRVDQMIDFRLNTVNMGRVQDETSVREVSKEVVVKETVYKPDSIIKTYGKVYAKITTTKRTMRSDGNLAVSIRDNQGQWLWNDNFRGDHVWTTEFSTYTGDERALSDSDKQLLNKTRENPPYEEEIMRTILRDITSNLHSRVRNYYTRY